MAAQLDSKSGGLLRSEGSTPSPSAIIDNNIYESIEPWPKRVVLYWSEQTSWVIWNPEIIGASYHPTPPQWQVITIGK